MKNNTKVRLHLSKKLFESLTREIIKEAKANDGYTVAVKQPKQPKQVKEVNAVEDTDKMKKMEEKMSSIDGKLTQVVDAILGNPLTKSGGFVDKIEILEEKIILMEKKKQFLFCQTD